MTDSVELKGAIQNNIEYIKAETLAVSLVFEALTACAGVEHQVGDAVLVLFVKVVVS